MSSSDAESVQKAKPNQCKGQNREGGPCAAQPVRPSGFCFFHDPALAAKRSEGRKLGGYAKSNKERLRKQLPPGVLTNEELLGLVGMTIARALSGKIEPGSANAVAALARAYVIVQQAGAVETLDAKVTELEVLIGGRTA